MKLTMTIAAAALAAVAVVGAAPVPMDSELTPEQKAAKIKLNEGIAEALFKRISRSSGYTGHAKASAHTPLRVTRLDGTIRDAHTTKPTTQSTLEEMSKDFSQEKKLPELSGLGFQPERLTSSAHDLNVKDLGDVSHAQGGLSGIDEAGKMIGYLHG